MTRRASSALIFPLVAAALIAAGCAKRPGTAQVSAPPPAGETRATAPPQAASTPRASTPSTSQPAAPSRQAPAAQAPARPVSVEYKDIKDLADVHFSFDKYEIQPTMTPLLDANAQWLQKNDNQLVLIEGHADERGTNEYNLSLGERRAKATMDYLVSRGVQPARITIMSYGEERPLCQDRGETCWGKNRRAHFRVKLR